MQDNLPLIRTIAAGFTGAWLLGLLTQRLGLSPIVGYLLAGVLIGPHTPGFVGDVEIAHQLAELGVILLMFGVGLHFHLKDLLAVRSVAIPGAVGQSLVATLLAVVVFESFGLPFKSSAVIGMAMAVASTVVLMRVLTDARMLESPQGHVAVGWLIVEDIFTVILLVLVPALGEPEPSQAAAGPAPGIWASLSLALLKLAALVVVVMVGGGRVIPWVMGRVARLRSRELFTLTVLVCSIAVATGAYYFFGASMALGAFLAGMVVAQSPVSHQAAADALPMRDAFAVLFFVSVGMLFDPAFILVQPLMVLAALGIILIAKPLAALLIVALLGHSVRTALTVALGLAQIGEFSFILSDLAGRHGLMPDSGHNVLVAASIISITLNPLIFRLLGPIESWLRRHPRLWSLLNDRAERHALKTNQVAAAGIAAAAAPVRHAVVVGFGPVGRSAHRLLKEAGLSSVVIDLNMDTVAELTAAGQPAIFGDASHASILEQAGVRRASHLLLTLPHSFDRIAIIGAARGMNPTLRILVRARYLSERAALEQIGATAAVFEEAEAAVALARLVLVDTGSQREAVEHKVRDLRLHLIRENLSNIRSLRIRTVMVPWSRVLRLSTSTPREEVLRLIARQRFTRWPVVDAPSGRCIGYLLVKDLIAEAGGAEDWKRLIRPLAAIRPEDDVASTLVRMQGEGASVCAVEEEGRPVGLITLEDILEQVVGRIEDEYPHETAPSLRDALTAGGIVPGLTGRTPEQVIVELAGAIPPERLPADARIAERALARETEICTDLGHGVAIPHARCPGLQSPLVVFGRSEEGVLFSPTATEVVRLVFLLVTPQERPELQLSLLAQLARAVGYLSARERLVRAASPVEVMEALARCMD